MQTLTFVVCAEPAQELYDYVMQQMNQILAEAESCEKELLAMDRNHLWNCILLPPFAPAVPAAQ